MHCAPKDADRVVSRYTTDSVKFVLAPPLQYTRGHPFGKKALAVWFSSFRGPIECENHDFNITAGNDVAFCHSLNRMIATTTKGSKVDLWFRQTLCFAKSMAGGGSRMSIARCPSTWTAATKRRLISSLRGSARAENLNVIRFTHCDRPQRAAKKELSKKELSMKMKLYEFGPTRSIRVRWTLQELGRRFRARPGQPGFRRAPAGRVPQDQSRRKDPRPHRRGSSAHRVCGDRALLGRKILR